MSRPTGLVVVSHSRPLAEAAVALADEMRQGGEVPVEIAAGLDDGSLGTDAVAIGSALTRVLENADAAVVLMDLGSAVLSAETALEFLDDAARARVVLCPAPLVEGLVVAVVTAAGGADAAAVAREARSALAGKESQLGADDAGPDEDGAGTWEVTGRFPVLGEHGLHARPAAALVRLVADAGTDAQVELRNATTGSPWVPGASLSRVATLGAMRGHEVQVRASGPRAADVVQRIHTLAEGAFGEAAPPQRPRTASPGIGIGPARQLHADDDLDDLAAADPTTETVDTTAELGRLDHAIEAVRVHVTATRDRLHGEEADLFTTHLALLDDPDLAGRARAAVEQGRPAIAAWASAARDTAVAFDALPDPYLRARAADVRAVGAQVLAVLRGTSTPESGSGLSGVLIAHDLPLALAAGLDPHAVTAVVLAAGSTTAHSMIPLRNRGIPAVVGAGPGVLDVPDGTRVAVDGTRGEVIVEPTETDLAELDARRARADAQASDARSRAAEPARTQDGTPVAVGANVGSLEDAQAAARAGADLVGLVRTEFLFLERDTPPDVDEQEAAYRALASAVGGKRLVLRTLDIGGDKPVPYLRRAPEANPFLGVRGLRLSLTRPDLLGDQLLAVVRVAHETPVSVMFPMVTTVEEVLLARRALAEAVAREGRGDPAGLEVGIMVEVPAAALKAADLARALDFLSIGTNDLTQYTLAAERGNEALAAVADPLDPAVLRLISETVRGAGDRPVAVCGDLAADEHAVPLLLDLGVRELSVAPPAVPGVKEAVRGTTLRSRPA